MRRFKKIYVEITNVCNLKCAFCPQTKRKAEFMDEPLFRRILGQIKPFTDYIYLHVKGEPLLHPKLNPFLDISLEKGFKVNITTNGTLINQVGDILIGKPAVRQINFSLHSFDAYQCETSKEHYVKHILEFSSRAVANSNIIISLRLWNLDEELITEDQRRRNLDIIRQIEEHFKLTDKIESNLAKSKALKLGNRVYLNQDYEFRWPELAETTKTNKGSCYGLRDQAAILVDGTVVPCCLDGEGIISLGNIKKGEFSDIISGQRAEDIRQGFCNGIVIEELCKKCSFRQRFNKN